LRDEKRKFMENKKVLVAEYDDRVGVLVDKELDIA
jgi:hypothetical protein